MSKSDLLGSSVDLSNGDKIGLVAIEITKIPNSSILQKRNLGLPNIDIDYKQDMASLLSEVFLSYKPKNSRNDSYNDICLEILWCTEEVKNQPFQANIKLYLIIRSIEKTENEIDKTLASILQICKTTLDFEKYEYKTISYNDLASRVQSINDQSIQALVKEERIEVLQNQLLPSCYAFAKLPVTEYDLSRIVNALIHYPNCAISFQLIPTNYSVTEIDAIEKMALALDTLNNGVIEQNFGNISFSLAKKHAEIYNYYSNNKRNALFAFNILVFGSTETANAIASRIIGQLNIKNELRFVSLLSDKVRKDTNFYPLPWAVNELLVEYQRNPSIWDGGQNSKAFYRLPYVITAEEASEFFRLPIGNENISAGLAVNETGKVSRSYSGNIIGGGDIEIGTLRSSSKNDSIGIFLSDFTKHMLIVGTPGSGKTTFAIGLLDRLWKEYKIPFLVIEPAKNEYRSLIQSIPEIQIFTPGKNFISPFVFNPFVPPKNVTLETYKTTLKTAFAAAVSMSPPLDNIFEESVNNCYSDFRWLDTYTSDDKGKIFNISDFIKCFKDTFEKIGYTGDAKNIGRAGVVRLTSLINIFDNYHSISIEDLLSKPTIIELAAVENSDQKALIIALLLLSISAYVNSNYLGEGVLRNVILLEEAHVLLGATSNGFPGEADPSAVAQGLVKRMLAEIRSFGIGIVIADQSPRKVTNDVIAMTDIKLAFRLVEAVDRQIIADSTNMTDIHLKRLARLKPGEAFLFFSKLDDPEEIITEDYRLRNNLKITISDEKVKSLITYWSTRQEKLKPYPECVFVKYCPVTCTFQRRVLARDVARRIFTNNFTADTKDSNIVVNVFSQISNLVLSELNDEHFNRELLSCVKVHLWRRIRYGTKIRIRAEAVQNSIQKM